MSKTKIDWADMVWNPVTGCTKISDGCQNCYAERMTKRLQLMAPKKYSQGFAVKCHHEALQEPLKIKKPQRIFVCSMSDLFHDDVPEEFIDSVFRVISKCPQHTFIMLTKRAERMFQYFTARWNENSSDKLWKPLPNVWLGVSAENQERVNERVRILIKTPAVVRFVSVEPMLGLIDLREYIHGGRFADPSEIGKFFQPLNWIICGGETGPGARPMHPDWVRLLRDQCAAANVPFFFKQWGEWFPAFDSTSSQKHFFSDGERMFKIGKKAAGHMLDGTEHREFPKKGKYE